MFFSRLHVIGDYQWYNQKDHRFRENYGTIWLFIETVEFWQKFPDMFEPSWQGSKILPLRIKK